MNDKCTVTGIECCWMERANGSGFHRQCRHCHEQQIRYDDGYRTSPWFKLLVDNP